MNKKMLYGILILVAIIIFTIVWKNSQKEKIDGGAESQNIATENKDIAAPTDTAASINKDINNIQVDSGIDEDIKAIDTDVKTL